MGLGPPILALYTQLKQLGVLDSVTEVMELGAQNVWCPRAQIVLQLFHAFSRPEPPTEMLKRFANWQGSASELHLALGMNYACVDLDPSFNSIALDLNFDSAPAEHRGRYDLVTNHGTSEHIMNQLNVFQVMHDFTKPGGLMLHAVPFTVHLEHGFFNYQPNFFDALARYNSYQTLGIWVGPDWQLASFIPWDPALLDYLAFSSKTTHLLVVAQRKMYDREFCVPFQAIYEEMVPDDVRGRYAMVVDGEVLDGKRVKYLTKDALLAKEYQTQITGLNNTIASYVGQVNELKHELAMTKYQLDQLRYGLRPAEIGLPEK